MSKNFLDRNLALEAVRVTEVAALSSSLHMGRGNEKAADQAAVNAMRSFLNNLFIDGKIVIGEGERDKAPMLYIGERVGLGGPKVDIALDPLEGTTITAQAGGTDVYLLVERGGRIVADGSPSAPIRFTASSQAPAAWGGVIIKSGIIT